LTRFGIGKVVGVSFGLCLAPMACGDDPEPNGQAMAGSGGDDGGSAAGKKPLGGSGGTASAGSGGTTTAGKSPTGGMNASAGGEGGTGPGEVAGASTGGALEQAGGANGKNAGGNPMGGDGNSGGASNPIGSEGGGGSPGGGEGGAHPVGGESGEGGQPSVCRAASYGDVEPLDSIAGDDGDGVIILNLQLQAGFPQDQIELELYDGLGTFADGIQEGTYTIEGNDLDYKYCSLCVIFYDQVNQFNGSRGWYLATGGTVTFTSVEGNLAGTLSNVTFQHVYQDLDGHSVPWEDGCTTSVDSIDFDTEILDG
jgi:hypothetical protein